MKAGFILILFSISLTSFGQKAQKKKLVDDLLCLDSLFSSWHSEYKDGYIDFDYPQNDVLIGFRQKWVNGKEINRWFAEYSQVFIATMPLDTVKLKAFTDSTRGQYALTRRILEIMMRNKFISVEYAGYGDCYYASKVMYVDDRHLYLVKHHSGFSCYAGEFWERRKKLAKDVYRIQRRKKK